MTQPTETTKIRAVADEDNLADELASLRIDREGRGALSDTKKSGGGVMWIVALVVVAALGVGGWLVFREGHNRMFPDEVELGTVTLVSPAQEEVTLVATGYVYPKKKAVVAPKTVGRLSKLLVEEGDVVKENQIIAELETARDAFLKGEYQKAIQLAQPMVASHPYPAWRLIGACRCFLKDKPGAQEAFSQLDEQGRVFLRYVCGRNGISLP